jgi:hypothetical protein
MAMLVWEQVRSDAFETWRTKVIGGWFVSFGEVGEDGYEEGFIFYPDPNHEWDGGSLP